MAHKTNQQIVKFVGKLLETDWLKFTHRTKRVVFLLSLSRSNKKNILSFVPWAIKSLSCLLVQQFFIRPPHSKRKRQFLAIFFLREKGSVIQKSKSGFKNMSSIIKVNLLDETLGVRRVTDRLFND